MTVARAKAVYWISALAIAAGTAGALRALTFPFADPVGRTVLRLYPINLLGGLLLIALGVAAAIGAYRRMTSVVTIVGAVFLLLASTQIVGINQSWNRLGGVASTASLLLGIGAGFVALAVSPEERGPAGG